MINVYLKDSELMDSSYSSIEEMKEELVDHFTCCNGSFWGISKVTNEEDEILNLDLEKLNSELENDIIQEKEDVAAYEAEQILLGNDYRNSIL